MVDVATRAGTGATAKGLDFHRNRGVDGYHWAVSTADGHTIALVCPDEGGRWMAQTPTAQFVADNPAEAEDMAISRYLYLGQVRGIVVVDVEIDAYDLDRPGDWSTHFRFRSSCKRDIVAIGAFAERAANHWTDGAEWPVRIVVRAVDRPDTVVTAYGGRPLPVTPVTPPGQPDRGDRDGAPVTPVAGQGQADLTDAAAFAADVDQLTADLIWRGDLTGPVSPGDRDAVTLEPDQQPDPTWADVAYDDGAGPGTRLTDPTPAATVTLTAHPSTRWAGGIELRATPTGPPLYVLQSAGDAAPLGWMLDPQLPGESFGLPVPGNLREAAAVAAMALQRWIRRAVGVPTVVRVDVTVPDRSSLTVPGAARTRG